MTTVIVVDDQALIREGLCTVLGLADDIDVVGGAADGRAALDLIEQVHPQVMLLDLRMPGMSGVEVCRALEGRRDAPAVLILTTHGDDLSISSALAAGARGYLTKDVEGAELIAAVHSVARGHRPLDPRVADRVIAGLPGAQETRTRFPTLSAREAEVLDLIGMGHSNSEIALRLVVEPSTVKSHVNAIFAKLGVRDRAQAIALVRGG